MRGRSSFLKMVLMALLAWAALLLFTYFVPPHTTQVFVVFFAILAIALIGTFSALIFLIGRGLLSLRLYRATAHPAIRQGTLLALVVVLNLLLLSLDSWSVIMAVVIFIAALIVEVLLLARPSAR